MQLTLATLQDYRGEELGVSEWVTIDQERIDRFAECTGDRQWIHVDVEKARSGPFGGTIAHGYLTLALLAETSHEAWWGPLGLKAAVNYGLDKVRFLAPVKAGARVRNRVKLVAVEDRGEGRQLITTENTIEIEGSDKPALVAITLALTFG